MLYHKLTIEEKEALRALRDHPGWLSLVKELENLAYEQAYYVLQYRLDEAGAEKLLWLKLRAEGAEKLVLAFKNKVKKIG